MNWSPVGRIFESLEGVLLGSKGSPGVQELDRVNLEYILWVATLVSDFYLVELGLRRMP